MQTGPQKGLISRALMMVTRGVRSGGLVVVGLGVSSASLIALGISSLSFDRLKKFGEELKAGADIVLRRDGETMLRDAEAISKVAAVREHAQLGVLDSPFNKIFRERVGVLKRTQPSFFAALIGLSCWLMRLQ